MTTAAPQTKPELARAPSGAADLPALLPITLRTYRAGAAEPELLQGPETLSGEAGQHGFTSAVRQLIFDLV